MNYPEIVQYVASVVDSCDDTRPTDIVNFRGLMEFMLQALTSEHTHIFEVERDLAFLMSVTDNDGLGPDTHLPFPFTFLDLDCDIDLDGVTKRLLGILLIEHKMFDDGIYATIYWREPNGRVNAGGYLLNLSWQETRKLTEETYALLAASGRDEVPMLTREEMREDRIEMMAVRSMTQNFLDMLDSDDIKITRLDARGADSKRVRQRGKMPLPPRTIVRMALPLRTYVNELKRGKSFGYNHAFWVRGHWRHYRAERYKASGLWGTKKYIWPYVKGKGLLVRKRYQVVGPEEQPVKHDQD